MYIAPSAATASVFASTEDPAAPNAFPAKAPTPAPIAEPTKGIGISEPAAAPTAAPMPEPAS